MIRMQAVALGRVQGVGFRWFVQETADRLGLTGFVENLPDGSVRMQLQGSRQDVELALQSIRRGRGFIRVDNLLLHKMETRPENSFSIY